MRVAKPLGLILALAVAGSVAFADGGGGTYYGAQTSRYPFLDQYSPTNNSMGLVYCGGYGYGVSDRSIIGGFGAVLQDPDNETGIRGACGGMVNGLRLVRQPVNLSIVSWTGLGVIFTGSYPTADKRHFLYVSEEIDLELGLPLTRWFMPTLYAGYQVAGNLVPDRPFSSFLSYSPVVGFRLAWGKFY